MPKTSKKHLVYLEIDDEVTAILDKVRRKRAKKIYLVAPKDAMLFQSIVNLEIVLQHAKRDGKKILLITNDTKGRHLAQKLDLVVHDKVTDEGKSAFFSRDEATNISPLTASVNAVNDDTPQRIEEKKVSIGEVLTHGDTFDPANRKKKKVQENKKRIVMSNSSKKSLIGLIAVSATVLTFILYIALPGATIYLTPTATQLEKSVNISLLDYQKHTTRLAALPEDTLAMYPVRTKVQKSLNYQASSKKVSGNFESARGTIEIYNRTANPWPLVTETRFENEEGIVFRIKTDILVPAATAAGPGMTEGFVVADEYDSNDALVGARGNIAPDKFFLPGLSADSRDEVYGESKKAMTGGVTDFITIVTEGDLLAAKSEMEALLRNEGEQALEEAAAAEAARLGIDNNYGILRGDAGREETIIFGEPQVVLDESLIGRELKEFNVNGEMEISGYFFDKRELMRILREELEEKRSPDKELLEISDKSLSYRIFEWNKDGGELKMTASIRGIEQFIIDEDSETGRLLLEKIRDHVAGKRVDEAELFIQNLPEINRAYIESWPAWSPTIPKIEDNIEFEIRDAVEV